MEYRYINKIDNEIKFDWSSWAEEFRKDMKKAKEKLEVKREFPQFLYVTDTHFSGAIHAEESLEYVHGDRVAVYVLEDIKTLKVTRELL